MYDFITGEMVAKATGHAEIVTGVIFLPDCKHIVSVSFFHAYCLFLLHNFGLICSFKVNAL